MTLLSIGLGMFMMVIGNFNSLIILGSILLLLVLTFWMVGSVRLHETLYGLQDKYRFANRKKQELKHFKQAQQHFRSVRTCDQWWQAICNAGQRLDLSWISLKTEDKDGNISTKIWRTENALPDLSKVVNMTIQLDGNGSDKKHEFELGVSVNSSYESAGHRVMLFSRLLYEYEVVN
jgi:hypothetical protein